MLKLKLFVLGLMTAVVVAFTATPVFADADDDLCEPYTNAPCTQTERTIIDSFGPMGPSCYTCLVNGDCLDDVVFSDTGNECEDATGTAQAGAQAGDSREDLCVQTLACITQTSCNSNCVDDCFCGPLTNACLEVLSSNTQYVKGPCKQVELDGLEHVLSDPAANVIGDFNRQDLGAGIANNILQCGYNNRCVCWF